MDRRENDCFSPKREGDEADICQRLIPSFEERSAYLDWETANNKNNENRMIAALGLSSMSPDRAIEMQKDLTELLATPQDKKFFSDFDKLAKRAGAPVLTDDQKATIVQLNEDQKEMFHLTLNRLNELADGKVNPAEYMINVMRDAAQLAEKHGRAPDSWNYFKSRQDSHFQDYLGMVMSQESHGFKSDFIRVPASGGTDHTGSALEVLSKHLIGKDAAKGFNPNIADDEDASSTVTHHFREFMKTGYLHGWQGVGNKAATIVDDPAKNPGDVRNAYYATMLGVALYWGDISPREAVNMTEWAYTKHEGTQPPWGSKAEQGQWLSTDQYDIHKWLAAFRSKSSD